uniref:F-box domain-containing protein n=1 Tax=Rhabditophanes sp. KR3021 TaxID=114890 RepID=A0AC35TV36_9BILA
MVGSVASVHYARELISNALMAGQYMTPNIRYPMNHIIPLEMYHQDETRFIMLQQFYFEYLASEEGQRQKRVYENNNVQRLGEIYEMETIAEEDFVDIRAAFEKKQEVERAESKKNEIFNLLPNEIWQRILSHVPDKQRDLTQLLNARSVSQEFKGRVETVFSRHRYRITKKAIVISPAEDALEVKKKGAILIDIAATLDDKGLTMQIKQLPNILKFVNFTGKLFLCESVIINSALFDIFNHAPSTFQPRAVVIMGRLKTSCKKPLLIWLRKNEQIKKLHFQDVEPDDFFLDDNFLMAIPNLEGFLVQFAGKRKWCDAPKCNFTMSGLQGLISLKTNYIFIPHIQNFRAETYYNVLDKYFKLCDRQVDKSDKKICIVAFGSMFIRTLNQRLEGLTIISNDDHLSLAYQMVRPDYRRSAMPIYYHSVDCAGTLISTTYDSTESFSAYSEALLNVHDQAEYEARNEGISCTNATHF